MSRTFRRKDFSPSDIAKIGYLYGEKEVWTHSNARPGVARWMYNYRRRPVAPTYDEYCKQTVSEFHRDAGNRYYANYSSAPWEYRNRRNRSLRTTHRKECHTAFIMGDGDLTPFARNVGWDYW